MSEENNVKAKIYTSEKIHFNREDLDSNYYRADLLFKGVDKRVPSYIGRVYLNNPGANYDTSENLEDGYVGYYTVFGHATCLGDEGHCEELPETRFGEIATPTKKGDYYITITDKLKHLARDTEDFSVTVIADLCKPPQLGDEQPDLENVIKIDKVAIELYDKELD
jgi:hypothetical protein